MDCPACQVPMREGVEAGARHHACPQCAGLWFADGDMARLLAAGPQAVDFVEETNRPVREPEPATALLCPDCGSPLMAYKYAYASPVELDGCERCGGVFVQDGELAAIQGWKDEEARAPDASEALATMAGNLEQAKLRAERVKLASRIAMMRRHWLTFDPGDAVRRPPEDLEKG